MNSRSLKSKPFRFKKIYPKGQEPWSRKPVIAPDGEEMLSGFFQGIPAKRDEEFFMTEAQRNQNVRRLEFRKAVGAPKGMPGWLELDALIETLSGFRAFEIDDLTFVHLGQRESAETKVKDTRRIDGLKKYGISVREIEHISAEDLEDRAGARRVIAELRL